MHYGHPDIFDRFFVQTCGSCSKASNGINLSEDIFAGFNCTARGYCVHHADYIQVKLQYYSHQTVMLFESRHLWRMKADSVSTLVPCPHRSTQMWLLYLAPVVGKGVCNGRFLKGSCFYLPEHTLAGFSAHGLCFLCCSAARDVMSVCNKLSCLRRKLLVVMANKFLAEIYTASFLTWTSSECCRCGSLALDSS